MVRYEPGIEVIVKMQKRSRGRFGGSSRRRGPIGSRIEGVGVDVNQELKLL